MKIKGMLEAIKKRTLEKINSPVGINSSEYLSKTLHHYSMIFHDVAKKFSKTEESQYSSLIKEIELMFEKPQLFLSTELQKKLKEENDALWKRLGIKKA